MRGLAVLFVVAVFGVARGFCAQDAAEVTLKKVNYDGLKETINSLRGKVVLVDFWSDLCLPCKRTMPTLVDKQAKYGPRGLVVVTVAIDSYTNPEPAPAINLKFLTAKKLNFLNLYLEDPALRLEDKFVFSAIPAYYVFSRQGKWTGFTSKGDAPVDYAGMDKLIDELVNEK